MRGWRQNRLAREARLDPSRISRYESGEDVPHPATLDRILAAGGLRSPLVAAVRSFIRLIRRALGSELVEPRSPGPERSPRDEVYLKEARLAEVQELAAEMVEIFQALNVQREATAALILFRDAAGKEAVTEDLLQRLQEYLKKARVNPKLRFPT